METNLVFEGLKFMALGMGTVFIFLITLIGMMILLSYVVHKYFPEPVAAPSTPKAEPVPSNNNKIAAIAAALMHHNQNR